MTLQPLRRVFAVVNGGTPTAEPENWGGDVPWATPVDLGRLNGQRIGETQRTITADGLRTGSSLVPAGSLIVSTRAPIGYVGETTIPMAFNQGCRGLVPRTELDVRFFRYQLLASAERLQVRGQGSTFLELSTDGLASFPLVVPPVEHQRAIADYLDAETSRLDQLVANRLQQVRALQSRRSSFIVRWMTSGEAHDHQGSRLSATWRSAFPATWGRVRLRFLVGPVQAGDWGDDPDGDNDVSVVRAADFDRIRWKVDPSRIPLRRVDPLSVAQRQLRPGDLVLEKSGGGPEQPVGAVVLYDIGGRAVPSNFAARLRPRDGVDPGFLCYVFAAAYAVGLNQRSIKQSTGIQNLDVGSYLSEEWRVPSHGEQMRIRAAIDAEQDRIDGLATTMTRQVAALLERRQALITAAVTGQLAIPGVAA